MLSDVNLDGINYKLEPYDFGTDIEISDRSIKMDFDPITRKPVPVSKTGTYKLLILFYSIKSWTYRGKNENGDLVTDESKPILPVTEENLKKIPSSHGNKLSDIASTINGVGEDERKNS